MMINSGKNSGQVLVMGLVMLLVLLFAIFFFFDVHNVIRAKLKLETAEQAAALTAARWQAQSLNLIGEINLLIATESVLLSDAISVTDTEIADDPEDTPEERALKELKRARVRVDALNEMQSRISFVGPLIALAAAQQTAKQNGAAIVKYPDNHLIREFNKYHEQRLNENNEIYRDFLDINGYKWLPQYRELVKEITNNGLAVRPNAMIVGIEGIDPDYLSDESLYSAIIACERGYPSWCHWRLRQLIKMDDSHFAEGIALPNFEEIKFSQQSEIYPIEVAGHGGTNIDGGKIQEDPVDWHKNIYDDFRKQGKNIGYSQETMSYEQARKYYGTALCPFYHYGRRWFRRDNIYSGPYVGDDTPWQGGEFLRGDLKEFAIYGGPVAYAECHVRVPSVISFRSAMHSFGDAEKNAIVERRKRLFAGTEKLGKDEAIIRSTGDINADGGTLIGDNYSRSYKSSGAVAKPIGGLGNDFEINPTEIPIILPVFHRANLIPSTMQKVRIFSFEMPLVEKFVNWLRDAMEEGLTIKNGVVSKNGTTIYDGRYLDGDKKILENTMDKSHWEEIYESIDPPEGSEYMLEALRLLSSKEFRRKGWNHDFKSGAYSEAALINIFDVKNKLYHPKDNPTGPGWLQQPAVNDGIFYVLPDAAKKANLYYYTKAVKDELNQKIKDRIEEKQKTDKDYTEPLYDGPKEDNETWLFFEGKFVRLKNGNLFESMETDPYVGCGKIGGNCNNGIPSGSNSGPPRL